MPGHGLTKENLLASLPPALMGDASIRALAEAVAEALAQRPEEIGGVRLYPRIGELDGPLLDVLAQDFKVDWWDSGYSLEEKRRTLQSSWQVHKTLGTKAAVERAASAIYPHTTVQEWFEYGGKPYYFKLDVGLPDGVWDPEAKRRLMRGLQIYKNLRSHMEAVEFHLPPVVLENPQALSFSLLAVALRARSHGALSLPRLLVGAHASGLSRSSLALFLRAPIFTAERLPLAHMALLAPLAEETRARLGGLRIQAGRVQQPGLVHASLALQGAAANPRRFAMPGFGAGFRVEGAGRLALPSIVVGARSGNPQSSTVYLARTDLRRFNGTHQFNGARRFNAGIKRSEL